MTKWHPIATAPKGKALLVKSAAGAIYIAAYRKWMAGGKELEAWWVVASKPYFCPTQIEVINPQGWQELPD